jgi:branched-chain amino acid transport system ATP-binding protein
MSGNDKLLELCEVNVFYGGIHALKGISLFIKKGEIVTLIGANGAGKSTTLNTISGLLRPKQGKVLFNGENLCKIPSHLIVKKGISQAPEGRKIFANMNTQENLELGAFCRSDTGQIKNDLDFIFNLFPRLKERRKQSAGTLSGGEQQMLAIGRALMSHPKLLLLDEPSLGLSPILTKSIFETIVKINKEGTTILLVEQNAHMALQVAQRGYVMETGKIVLEDFAQALLTNEKVKSAYLGG